MDKKLFDVEAKLLEPAQMTSDDKYFQQAYRVYMNLIWLNGEVGPGAGDVSGGADFPPTDTSVNVMETIEKDLNAAKADYKNLMDRDVPGVQPRDRRRDHAADGRATVRIGRIQTVNVGRDSLDVIDGRMPRSPSGASVRCSRRCRRRQRPATRGG